MRLANIILTFAVGKLVLKAQGFTQHAEGMHLNESNLNSKTPLSQIYYLTCDTTAYIVK